MNYTSIKGHFREKKQTPLQKKTNMHYQSFDHSNKYSKLYEHWTRTVQRPIVGNIVKYDTLSEKGYIKKLFSSQQRRIVTIHAHKPPTKQIVSTVAFGINRCKKTP